MLRLLQIAITCTFFLLRAESFHKIPLSSRNQRLFESQSPSSRDNKIFQVTIPLGDGYQPVVSKFKPLFEESGIFITTYEVPFSLNVKPKGKYKLPGKNSRG